MDALPLIRRAGRLLAGAAVLGLGAVVIGCAANEMAAPARAETKPSASAAVADVEPPAKPVRAPRQDAVGLRTSFADVLEPALDSVVSIEAITNAKPSARGDQRQFRMPFGMPFEMPDSNQPEDSFGSGVVVRGDGVILTNNHVVDGADEVRVRFFDNREARAKVLGTDPLTDIAVIKVETEGLPALPFGTSADLRVGDVVFAIGSPFALSQSVTMGIVSATGRSKLGITRNGYEDFIQTDAPINPGNSGGALLDSRGDIVGINTAIFSSGARGNQGIGFAVPADMARRVMEQILTDGKVVRSQLGVRIKEVDSTLAKSYGLDKPMGALVVDVESDSPAEKAGLKPEDLIVELDGKGVVSDAQLRLDISSRKPGSQVELAVLREQDGRMSKKTLDAELRELRPDGDDEDEKGASAQEKDGALRGLVVDEIDELTQAQRKRLGLSDLATGVLVTTVVPGSPAQRAGMSPGDVITAVNQQPVTSVEEFRSLARSAADGIVRLRVLRGGATDIVALEP